MREQPSDRLVPPRTIGPTTYPPTSAPAERRGRRRLPSYASERGVRLLGRFEGDGDRWLARNRPLRLALIPRERSARQRTSAVDARRPCRHRHARGLSGKERHRPFWEIVSRYRVMFSGVPTLYVALMQVPVGDSDISSLRVAIWRRRADAGGPHPRFRSKDGSEDSRRLRPHGRLLRFVGQSGRRRASHGHRSACPSPISGWKPSCLDGDGRFQRMADVDEVGVIAISGPNVFKGYLGPPP